MNDPQEHDGFEVVPVSERKWWKIADLTSSVGAGVLDAPHKMKHGGRHDDPLQKWR